ncbi:MAG: 2-oxoglutarate dehydrogenase complex dihydrolipoyllysine-residue succinyltransferase, partial [Dichotomicrobium sp.]
MAQEIRVPTLGESVTEATVAQWFKKSGESVNEDEPVVELETDKVTVEVPAPVSGVISSIAVNEGETVEVGALLGAIDAGAGADTGAKEEAEQAGEDTAEAEDKAEAKEDKAPVKEEAAPAAAGSAAAATVEADRPMSPAVRKLAEENNLDTSRIEGSGKDGRVLKGDILSALDSGQLTAEAPAQARRERGPVADADAAREERVRMTKLRQTIARRLKEAQNTAAMLTTFNEADMSAIMEARERHKAVFEKKHGVRLGFMAFFVKACVRALHDVPSVNAELDGEDLIYKNYYHIGVAVGTERGLVVPVLRDADAMSFAEIEGTIADFGKRAQAGKLGIDEMQGGTFTISNGGVYGSLMSMPILNVPQSGILGMHKIQERPVAVNGSVEVRPMMYLALSYDHRVIDGKEAVTFLVRVKENLEDPERLLLDL